MTAIFARTASFAVCITMLGPLAIDAPMAVAQVAPAPNAVPAATPAPSTASAPAASAPAAPAPTAAPPPALPSTPAPAAAAPPPALPSAPAPAAALVPTTAATSAAASPLTERLPVLAGSALSLRGNYVSLDGRDDDLRTYELSLMGQVVARSGWGAYASLPIAHARTSDESESTLGGLELGGVYATSNHELTSVVRFGAVLPTGPDLDAGDDAVVGAFATFAHLPDAAQLAPASAWVRLTYSPTLRRGVWLASADLGLDLPVVNAEVESESGTREVELDALVRANFALGAVSDRHQLLVEFNTLYNLENDGDQMIHTIGASYRYLGKWEPFLSMQQVVGLPESDFFSIDLGLGVSLGVATRL